MGQEHPKSGNTRLGRETPCPNGCGKKFFARDTYHSVAWSYFPSFSVFSNMMRFFFFFLIHFSRDQLNTHLDHCLVSSNNRNNEPQPPSQPHSSFLKPDVRKNQEKFIWTKVSKDHNTTEWVKMPETSPTSKSNGKNSKEVFIFSIRHKF
jgi:hypothetical protein